MKNVIVTVALLSFILITGSVLAEATLRGDTALDQQPEAPHMEKIDNSDMRRVRNYPEQPPTIPHKVRDYRIDTNSNKCLSCHSRVLAPKANAPMISVTHFMDRDNQVLSEISPRRYFCTQCHVPQVMTKPLVGNDFIDAADMPKSNSQ